MDSSQQLELSCSKGIFFFFFFSSNFFCSAYISGYTCRPLLTPFCSNRRGKEEGRDAGKKYKTIYRCRDRVN